MLQEFIGPQHIGLTVIVPYHPFFCFPFFIAHSPTTWQDLFGTVRITVIHKLYNATEKLPVTVDVSPLMQNVPETAMQWDLVNKNNSIFAT